MSDHVRGAAAPGATVDCGTDPVGSLVQMFVGMVQAGRIAKGQCPAMRPVFLKPHGVAAGTFRIRPDLPDDLKVGLFAGSEFPAWVRFSSDTLPTISDWTTTCGIGIKLFGTPTPKIFGLPDETTFDFILQNFDVFFVDTAKDMCEFTKAGVVDGDYGPYLEAHPKTADILKEMARPVGSVLGTPYWAILPFAFGPDRYVKYRLSPTVDVPPPAEPPVDPTYLAADLEARLKAGEARFVFEVQFRTDPATMPLDAATVRWPVAESPFIPVADLILPQQDITRRGQAEYGENMAWNIWRVTAEHAPQGSIAEARRVVYAASAEQRRNVNGVPVGEPVEPRPSIDPAACADDVIVRAAIHPAIGIARVGDAESDYFIGPETTAPAPADPNYYRDADGALKRQAAQFRLYGYNAAGEVVRELTVQNADIEWTVHVANRKADWYQFITAMDIPESADLTVTRRNPKLTGDARTSLAIDPGPRSIAGPNQGGGPRHAFDTGTFQGVPVPLGELRTDSAGRLIFLGGHGVSASPEGLPPYDPADPDSFNNANDWYDDMSDGPVDARVSIDGREVPVEGAWVVTAPPNYAPDVLSWRTMYDMLVDVATAAGWIPVPETTSFTRDVLPQLARMTHLQWVNKGFAALFGAGGPLDFSDPTLLGKLAAGPDPKTGADPWAALRRSILNAFRPYHPQVNEPRLWPFIYGDDFGGELFAPSPNTMLALPSIQQLHLRRWADGLFEADWDPTATPPASIDDVPLAEQPATLDRAALDYCLADAFHPGCEITWPMRHQTLYSRPFRIRRRPAGQTEPDYGPTLDQATALGPTGPLHGQGPGDVTRWMGLPWQGDTAYCRSGYDPSFDPYLPTFWPARVPNQVLTEEDYQIVVSPTAGREEKLAAFNRRASWYRFIDASAPDIPGRMMSMIRHFGAQGIVEARPGPTDDPDIPSTLFVENLPAAQRRAFATAALAAAAPGAAPAGAEAEAAPAGSHEALIRQAGWGDAAHLEAARRLRARKK